MSVALSAEAGTASTASSRLSISKFRNLSASEKLQSGHPIVMELRSEPHAAALIESEQLSDTAVYQTVAIAVVTQRWISGIRDESGGEAFVAMMQASC